MPGDGRGGVMPINGHAPEPQVVAQIILTPDGRFAIHSSLGSAQATALMLSGVLADIVARNLQDAPPEVVMAPQGTTLAAAPGKSPLE